MVEVAAAALAAFGLTADALAVVFIADSLRFIHSNGCSEDETACQWVKSPSRKPASQLVGVILKKMSY